MASVWTDVIIRIMIGIAAGEIAIRYAAWWGLLRRADERLSAAPVILGVAICAAALCAVEIQWMLIRAAPVNVRMPTMSQGNTFMFVARSCLLAGACFLTVPVAKVQYSHSWERALVEMLVRLFLIVVSFIAGIECATIYHCQILGAC